MSPEQLIKRGWYLFPCKGKRPLVKWAKASSKELPQIALWAKEFQLIKDLNWGIDCGKSGLAVLDIDSGKTLDAEDSLFELESTYGKLPKTFTVETQSGGEHRYYKGDIRNSASTSFGSGIDTRGKGGFVVAPNGKSYRVTHDRKLATVPGWVVSLSGQARTRTREELEHPVGLRLDTPENIERGVQYLQTTEPAIEGQGGDHRTYTVACHLRDFGLSEDKALELMHEHFNPRCLPAWEPEDLQTKANNAYNYAHDHIGNADPTTVFPVFVDPDPAPAKEEKSFFLDMAELMEKKITIDWLVQDLIETPTTGMMFGDSGVGKSFLAVGLAMGVATGTTWLGRMCARGPVIYLVGEGGSGLPRRAKAWCKERNIPLPKKNFYVSRTRFELNEQAAKLLVEEVRKAVLITGPPKLILVDTMARHLPGNADENSAKDTGNFFNAVDYLRDAFGCVVLVVHHTGHSNKHRARGSYNIRAPLDFEFLARSGAIECTKMKEADLWEPMGFALKQVELEEGITSAVAIQSSVPGVIPNIKTGGLDCRIAVESLAMAISSGGGDGKKLSPSLSPLVDDWRSVFKAQFTSEYSADCVKKKFKRAKTKLIEENVIEMILDGDDEYVRFVDEKTDE